MSGATDYLTCGQCLKEFPLQLITLFIQHKKLDCDDDVNLQGSDPELQCNYCPQGFMTAWALLVHAQLTHNLKIFLEKASQTLLKEIRIPNTSSNLQIEHGDSSSPNFGIQPNSKTTVTNAASVKNLKVESLIPRIGDIPVAQTTLNTYQDKTPSISSIDAKGVVNTKPVNTVVLKDLSESINATEITKGVSKQSVCRLLSVSTGSNLHLSPGQKLNIYPIKSADVAAIPKLGVIPLTFTSNPVSSSSIKVLPAGLLPTSVSESCSAVTNSPQTVLTLVKNDVSTPSVSVCRSGQTVFKIADTEGKLVYQSPPKIESLNSQISVLQTVSGFSSVNTAVSWPVPVTTTTAQQEGANNQFTDVNATESIDREAESQGHEEENADIGDDDDLDAESPACCDRQGCGVTVIPVSHEDLQKCCNAVVPKKRKRHMEQKHMPFSWSSSRYARRKMYNRSLMSAAARSAANQCQTNLSTAGTIYIDLEPDLLGLGERSAEGQDETSVKVTQSVTPETRTQSSTSTQIAQSRPHSLILKPGAVYSIPFTYTIPTTFSIPKSSTVPVAGDVGDSNSSSSFAGVGTSFTDSSMSAVQDVSTDGNLDDHDNDDTKKRQHSSAKPFQCEKCTMAFNQRIHLKKHMSKHTGIKPYKCGECNYSTVERSHLKVHIRIHTGEKPFKCTYCEYATAQNSTLKIHLKRHHGGRMFQCKGCEKQFTQEEQLRGHEWEHGGKPGVSSNTKEDADTSVELASTPGSTTTSSTVQEQNTSAASSLHSSPGMRFSIEASANQNEALIETKTSPSAVVNDDDESSLL